MFQETLDVRPHLLILNKIDLADVSNKQVRSPALLCTFTAPGTHELMNHFPKPEPYLCPTDPPEETCKKGSGKCFLYRLFDTKRSQCQTGKLGKPLCGVDLFSLSQLVKNGLLSITVNIFAIFL